MAVNSCAETTLRNVSGGQITLSLFQGRVLSNGEHFTIPGDVYAYIAASNPGIKGRRLLSTFRDLLENNVISITDLPDPNNCGQPYYPGSSSSTGHNVWKIDGHGWENMS